MSVCEPTHFYMGRWLLHEQYTPGEGTATHFPKNPVLALGTTNTAPWGYSSSPEVSPGYTLLQV